MDYSNMSEEIKDIEAFEQRVTMIEEALDRVDAGMDDPCEWIQVDDFMDDPCEWIQVDDFMAMMRNEHPWLSLV